MEVLSPARRRLLLVLQAVLALVLVAYLVGTVGPGPRRNGSDALYDGWLYNGLWALGGVLCLLRAAWVRAERRSWGLIGGGLLLYLAGNLVYYLDLQYRDPIPYPSTADVLWLSFYPLTYAAIILRLREQTTPVPRSAWLDGVVGGLAAGALGAAIVDPVLRSTGGSRAVVLTNVTYPVADLLLIVLLVTGAALLHWRPGRSWWLLTAGLVALAATDSLYLVQIAEGSYVDGGPLDAGWVLALALLVVAAWVDRTRPAVREDTLPALLVPGVFALLALGLLAVATERDVGAPARVLAVLAVLVAVVRTTLTFRELRELAQVRHQAHTDDLTDLPNRRDFLEQLEQQVASRRSSSGSAVMVLDLDHFKEVNDGLGHAAGDELLRQVGPRLLTALRPQDQLARMGGDEFAVLLVDTDEAAASRVARRLVDSLHAPFHVGRGEVSIGVSAGVALFPAHGADASSLLRWADGAMYKAKTQHLGFAVHDEPSPRAAAESP